MDDIACPRCKTTKYRNPSLRLMVNVCGHALCENCVELLFVKGSSPCPECHITLRRGNFRIQMFEDAQVEKEVDIRKKVMRDFNKHEDDFATLREYNDYLEEVENIICNLTNNIDVEATRKRIEQYKKENKALIVRNNNKLSKQEEYLEELIESEQLDVTSRRQQLIKEELQEKRLRLKNKEALIDELMFSDAPAGEIVASHVNTTTTAATTTTQKTEPRTKDVAKTNSTHFSTGIKLWQTNSFLPIPKQEEAPLFRYQEVTKDTCGPVPPPYDSLHTLGYLDNTKCATDAEKAGGFVSNIACYRALEEAFCGLFCGLNGVEKNTPQIMDAS